MSLVFGISIFVFSGKHLGECVNTPEAWTNLVEGPTVEDYLSCPPVQTSGAAGLPD